MLIDIPCNLCGSNNKRVIYPSTAENEDDLAVACACTNAGHGAYYQLVKCTECGLEFSSPRPSKKSLEEGYSEVEDKVYESEIDGRIRTFERNLNNISQFKQSGSLLDIGCSMGVFLDQAQKKGWRVQGIEPSRWCAQQGRDRFGLPIKQGTIEDLAELDETFDVVTLWDVLEHVDDPMETLKLCRKVVKEDGVFVFSTVDRGSAYARLMGRRWPWLMKMHIYYFDRPAIRRYLDLAGFELLKIKVYKHTVSLDYLMYKMKGLFKPVYFLLYVFKKMMFRQRSLYVTIGLGDFVEVYARPKR